MTPVYLTSTYAQASPGVHKGFEYSRTQNPTRFALQDCLAALEGGGHGLAFASGLAATDALLHLLDAGDHVVASDDVYGGTFRLFDKVFRRLGLEFTPVDMTDPGNVAARAPPQHPAGLDREPHQPACSSWWTCAAVARDLQGPRRALGGGQHLRHPVLPAAARAGDRRWSPTPPPST